MSRVNPAAKSRRLWRRIHRSCKKLHHMLKSKTLTPIKILPKTITLHKMSRSRKYVDYLAMSRRRRMMQLLPATSTISCKDRLRDNNSHSQSSSRFSRNWLKVRRRLPEKTNRTIILKWADRRAETTSKSSTWIRDHAEWNQARACLAMRHQWWYLLLTPLLISLATKINQALQTTACKIEACASNPV